MAKGLIQNIAEELKSYQSNVFLVENNDRFLYREDVIKELKAFGVDVVFGTSIQQRIQFELREEDTVLVLLSQDISTYLEDIKQKSTPFEFFLNKYLNAYHIPSIIDLDLKTIDILYFNRQIIALSKTDTLLLVEKIKNESFINSVVSFDLSEFVVSLNLQLDAANKNWSVICRIISNGILNTIGSQQFDDLLIHVNRANDIFQEVIKSSYDQIKNSSAVKKPKIVSKILDYLNFNFSDDKLALIVIDGLAFWQYELLKNKLPESKVEDVIYSWIPSITQLSRQAIFRGDRPQIIYNQGPVSEEKLWKNYWKEKGFNDFEIKYNHENIVLGNLGNITKFAIVFKDLDEKMHSSSDNKDLLKLTENWIERSKIYIVIQELLDAGFRIFLTTDHGNIQARGWRSLKGREKLGTNKSGSRSERHIEYTDQWLSDEFLNSNPNIKDDIVIQDQAIYFKTDLSFSQKTTLVTHGGSHLLEVLIPFIEIKNE
ncbi:MAG: PglZ domain-containing protein [Bacteroidales bacterium]